jgi:hypothetical protein
MYIHPDHHRDCPCAVHREPFTLHGWWISLPGLPRILLPTFEALAVASRNNLKIEYTVCPYFKIITASILL